MIRLFVGLPLAPDLAARLAALAGGIPGARWVEARNLHVTLRFVGEVEDGLAEDLHDALATIAAPPFTLAVDGFGTFGSRKPHSLFAHVVPDEPLERLQHKIEAQVVRSGLPPEPRRFQPHVTLARLNASPPGRIQDFIQRNSPFFATPMPVSHFTLFRSHLSRNGAEYEAVAEYPL